LGAFLFTSLALHFAFTEKSPTKEDVKALLPKLKHDLVDDTEKFKIIRELFSVYWE